nr:nucleotide-binding alpha-beta plait domain-containing protein [Tanacetum cinerariifolium]
MNARLFTSIPLDNSLTISHLFYADDTIFVEKWDSSNLKIILKVLKYFRMASGLKININKSKLMGYSVHSDEVETAARFIVCATFVAPFSHLGVKVVHPCGGTPEAGQQKWDIKAHHRSTRFKSKTYKFIDPPARWNKFIPVKINIVSWRAMNERIPKRANLDKSFRTKEDNVAKISTSIYITNFPESLSAKELFHTCKQYGHVVDSFIPTKRDMTGKWFGFVRFINIFNQERLVNNLCTVGDKSYMGAVKGVNKDVGRDSVSSPVLVLGDECMAFKDLSLAIFGRVKEFTSLANIQLAIGNDGFTEIKIKYMGELWVMMEFTSK